MNRIIHGDCLEELDKIPAKSVRLCVTSPPYGNTRKEYDTDISGWDEYEDFIAQWTDKVSRILTNDGAMWINIGTVRYNGFVVPLAYVYFNVVNMDFNQEIVWHFEGGQPYKSIYTIRTQRWMWYVKSRSNYVFNLDSVRDMSLNRTVDKRNNPLGKNPTDYWYYNRVTNNSHEKTNHPTQFPEKMIERIVIAHSDPGDTVIDPFSGSGTTALVAKKLGRNYIGIEKREDYYKASLERLSR